MFALLDLAFEDSPACPGGGYTSVRGRYTKQHWLLMQQLVEIDAGDPIFYCSDPFELMHKLMTRSAYVLSTKHRKDGQGCPDKGPFGGASESGDRVAAKSPPPHPRRQNLVDRVFTLFVPLALGLPFLGLPLREPLAPLVDPPTHAHLRTLCRLGRSMHT